MMQGLNESRGFGRTFGKIALQCYRRFSYSPDIQNIGPNPVEVP